MVFDQPDWLPHLQYDVNYGAVYWIHSLPNISLYYSKQKALDTKGSINTTRSVKKRMCVCVLILAHQEYLVIKKERKLKYVFSQCKFFRLIIKKHTS